MVFVKVRETYDLHTVKGKMTTIAVHTPKPDIIKANFPGLLMQCKAYRPVSCDVRIACASTLPLDPLGVGTSEGDVAPEDLFNPILYKACTNFGMSQIEARILANTQSGIAGSNDVFGNQADVDVDSVTSLADEFPVYYGLLSNAHEWRHANPQAGLEMTGLKPLVFEYLANVGDNRSGFAGPNAPAVDGTAVPIPVNYIRGNAKPLPFINCTSYTGGTIGAGTAAPTGFLDQGGHKIANAEQDVPWINCVVGAIIIPPSRLHELFYRMVCEWTIEFSQIRPLSEITHWTGLSYFADATHYQNYSFEETKKAFGVEGEVCDKDSCMVSASVDVNKVM